MFRKIQLTAIAAGLVLAGFLALTPETANAQGRYANVYSKSTVNGFINTLEQSSNTFRRDFDRAMDRSNLNGTDTEDRYNETVKDYERSLNTLKRQFNRNRNWWEARNDVQEMISKAQPVNSMMINLPFARNLERQWNGMRNDINKVADTFDLPGLNGGGWQGGGNWGGGNNNGGGWNGGWNGQTQIPPVWAQGNFYSTNITGYQMTVTSSGQVTVNGPNGTQHGRWWNGAVVIGNERFPATQTRDGMRAYNSSTRQYTNYSRNWGGGSGGNNGGNTGGNTSTPPRWAQGSFYSQNIQGYNLTINSNGSVTLMGPQGTSYGRWYNGSIYINNEQYPASQMRGGLRARNNVSGIDTIYIRR